MKHLDKNDSAAPTECATTADTLVTAWLSEYAGSGALQMMTPASQRQLRDAVHLIVADQGDVNVDKEDIRQVLAAAVSLQFGKATARGTQRVEMLCRQLWQEAIVLGEATKPANRILLAIQSGTTEELEMDELTQLLEYVVRQAGDQAEVVFGHGLNPALGESIQVVMLVSRS